MSVGYISPPQFVVEGGVGVPPLPMVVPLQELPEDVVRPGYWPVLVNNLQNGGGGKAQPTERSNKATDKKRRTIAHD